MTHTTESLMELRKLAEAATPGPWAFGTFHRLLVVQADKHGNADKHSAIADIGAGSIPWDATAESMQEYNDADYIAAANPAKVIELLDAITELVAERDALAKDAARWRYSVEIGSNQSMNWLDVYYDWDGEGSFELAIDAAMKETP